MENKQETVEMSPEKKLEFYRLIGEGFKDIREHRTSTIDEVRNKLKKIVEESWGMWTEESWVMLTNYAPNNMKRDRALGCPISFL